MNNMKTKKKVHRHKAIAFSKGPVPFLAGDCSCGKLIIEVPKNAIVKRV